MARVCGGRIIFYSFLTVALSLSGFTLAASDIHARNSSRDSSDDPLPERVQQLLSDQKIEDSEAIKLIFKEDDNALPTLLRALREGKNVERASWALSYLGRAKERQVLRRVVAAEKNQKKKWLIAGFLAGALVEPASAEEWQFLETCLRAYKNENTAFASFSAAVALGINASPKALHLLQTAVPPGDQAQESDNDTVQEVRDAIRWIKQRTTSDNPAIPPETDSDSEQIKQIVLQNAFYAEGQRERLSVEDIVFTRDKGRALVSVQIYRGPKDAQGYDMVLERRSGMWKITGAWFSWAA